MDNLQFWIYVVVAVIYLVSRAMKKAPAGAPGKPAGPAREPEADGGDADTGESRPMSFEELLREITEAKKPRAPEPQRPPQQPERKPVFKPRPAPEPVYADEDEDLPEEAKSLEGKGYDYQGKGSVYEAFEKGKKEAFDRPSLETLTAMGSGKPGDLASEIEYQRFGSFSITTKKTLLDEYVKELRSPSGFKKAFIMSEILNRKY